MKSENKSGGRKREGEAAVRGPKALTPGSPGRRLSLDPGGPSVSRGRSRWPCPSFHSVMLEEAGVLGAARPGWGDRVPRTSAPLPPELLPPEDGVDGAVRVTAWGSVLEDVFH